MSLSTIKTTLIFYLHKLNNTNIQLHQSILELHLNTNDNTIIISIL